MKKRYLPFFGCVIPLIIILTMTSCAPKSDFPVLSGEYLGQDPPGLNAALFAEGIVSTVRKEKNFGGPDLYISFRGSTDGSWGPLINMGESVNSNSGENCQILSPCGRYLFFTSRRSGKLDLDTLTNYEAIRQMWAGPLNGGGNIYWVDAQIIDRIKDEAR